MNNPAKTFAQRVCAPDLIFTAVRLSDPDSDWTVTGYVDNLFDTFAETGVRGSNGNNRFILSDENGDPVYPRSVFTNVIPPRQIGIRFTKSFGL